MLQVTFASLQTAKASGWQACRFPRQHILDSAPVRCRASKQQAPIIYRTRADTAVRTSASVLPALPSIYALDVEFIHIRYDGKREESLPAQVCLVDRHSRVIYKSYIRHPQLHPPPPGMQAFGGVKLQHVQQAPDLSSVVEQLRTAVCLPLQSPLSTTDASCSINDSGSSTSDNSTHGNTNSVAAIYNRAHRDVDSDSDQPTSGSSMAMAVGPLSSPTLNQPVLNSTPGKLIGHGLWKDLVCLGWEHPTSSCFDTTSYAPFQGKSGSAKTLQALAWKHLERRIQPAGRGHDPQEDACAVMDLYVKFMESSSQQSSYEDLVALYTHKMLEKMKEAAAEALQHEEDAGHQEDRGESSEQTCDHLAVDSVLSGLSSFGDNRL